MRNTETNDAQGVVSLGAENAFRQQGPRGPSSYLATQFGAVQRYGVILVDAPWTFKVRSQKGAGRSASQHYSTMSLDDIQTMPVGDLAADDCALFLWATDPMLPQALDVIEAWGFRYKTVGFTWAKTNADGSPFCGMGYWTRANTELCLLATRGAPKRKAKDVRRLVISPRREHSRKPAEVRAGIQRLLDGPYIELFARERAPGWDSWGDEVGLFDADHHGPSGLSRISWESRP